jgi:hypothetical protein
MVYQLLADLVTVLHLAFVVFVVLGGLLAFRWPRLVWAHVPAAAWGAFIEFSGRICPLTPLEVWLRRRGGAEGYSGGFVEQYVIPVLYPADLSTDIQILLGVVVTAINAVVYGLLLARYLRRRQNSLSRQD